MKHIKEPKYLDRGAETEVFKFKPEKGKDYVYKEVRNNSYVMSFYHGESLKEKAFDMKRVYDILKKHYGDRVADTYFIVGKNKEGEPCIMKIQEEIKGTRLLGLKESDPRYKGAWEQAQEIRDNLSKVALEITEDPGFKGHYPINEAKDLVNDIDTSINLFVDEEGKITAMDW